MSKKRKKEPTTKSNKLLTIGIVILIILIALAVGLSRTLRIFH
jgi:flagellar basal body-associated protein FliL